MPELIGRRSELAVLGDALADAAAGSGRLVLVEGDAGVGKTRLVAEFADRAARDGATVLSGGCPQLEADIPYAAFDEALPGTFFTGRADRASEFRRVAETIAGAGRPVVLVLEDLHWADASTRDLLVFLQRALRHAPVLQIGTHRSGEVGGDHPVAGMVAELARQPHAERLRLGPLDPAETTALARGLLGVEPGREMVRVLLSRAEGNPFFTEELIAAWPARGGVPQTVREVVITRLARLTEGARELSRLASVIGRTVSHDLLAELAELSEVDIGGSVRDLVHHGQLVAGEDGYAFRHALIREAIYADLLPGERRTAHARVARLLAARPTPVAELAHHWDAAGEVDQALVASVRAGESASAAFAPAEAGAHYERALRRWREASAPEELTGLDLDTLLERAAAAASMASRNRRAVELTRERLALLDPEAFPERVALANAELAHRAWASADWPLARSANLRALELIPADSPERVAIMAHRAGLAMLSSRHRDALRFAHELLPEAEAAGDTFSYARGVMVLAISSIGTGHVEEGLTYLRRHLALANETRMPRLLGVNYANHPEALVWVDRPEEALTLAREGIARAAEFGFDFYLLLIVGNQVRALAELCRWDEALDAADDPVDQGADAFTRLPMDLARADLYLRRGDRASAAVLLATCADVLTGQDDVQHGTELSALQALLAAREGRWADARAAAGEGLRVAQSADNQHRAARVLAVGLRVEADAGLPDSPAHADALLSAGEAHLAAMAADGALLLARTRRYLALARAEHSRVAAPSPQAWAEVAEVAAHDRHLLGYARFRFAEAVLLTRGARQQAVTALAEASAVAASLKALPLAEDVRALAERARLTLPEVAPAPAGEDPDGLTAREAEVLALVGLGRTNAEIADELFISVKTASVHVSNILRKLGMRSRIQAAAVAQRRGLSP
ncbi:AAA ATPase-like protein [Actinophytocola oryzae]|uniref:AAA ATPase-like protein n=1 Tax=Actinophytocola oryzae TaxID=502181 RepID=A0A4R7V236_9PSEU|nr:AAA ATPase-like protein [Actinophytocola oryzae]